jgi:hypothetical protein
MMAITLELCGVSSLAFAVGVYVPIQFSVPIFMGGILRWGIDKYVARTSAASIEAAGDDVEARARAEIDAIRKTETSPGVLLASGYIAGGSLAGVVAAFLEFPVFEQVKNALDFSAVVTSLRPFTKDFIAVGVFALLIAFAVLVGTGRIFKGEPEDGAALEQ